jgi:hypothetical protein
MGTVGGIGFEGGGEPSEGGGAGDLSIGFLSAFASIK